MLSELMILRYVADNRQIKLDMAQELTQVSDIIKLANGGRYAKYILL